MSTVTVKRPPRIDGPEMPSGAVELQEPPVMAEPAPLDLRSFMMVIPMGLGMGGMVMMFGLNTRSSAMYLMGGVMFVGMLSMGLVQIGRAVGERKRKMKAERRDFLRYIAQLRKKARESADQQRRAVCWNNPEPGWLWSIAMASRIWERRAGHDDFARVRIGLGRQSAAVEYVPPSTKPIEDLEPLSSISLRRFTEAYRTVDGIPTAIGLRSFTSIEFAGELEPALGLARAMLAQLITFHAPDELRVAVLTGDSASDEWEWVKWLPHNAHPTDSDAAGSARLFARDHTELMKLLGPEVLDRGDHDKAARPGVVEPFVVVVASRTEIPEDSRLLGAGVRNLVLLDVTGSLPGGPKVLRLTVKDAMVEFPVAEKTGEASCDQLSLAEAEALARVLAPKRTSGTLEVVDEPLESDFELTTLLGIKDAYTFDVNAIWRPRQAQRARLSVPIGVTDGGEVVELDIKESAQGGMGPHGLLIGATGSGKSELLRTLVCGLAATHSSEILNLVLVDFKGGATFLGMDSLPHVSAVITNLEDELPLVDRMYDALHGEMVRRQELLRAAGNYASLRDYERAREQGADLRPLPTLFVVLDEFSELLSAKPEFIDLFVMIGRLGRSLGVHLLLASQRLEEGRLRGLDTHLSYRIGLRTFSAMESRVVLGVADAYELPSAPGNGYLKFDTSGMTRFKAAYVSGPFAPEARQERRASADQRHVVVYGTAYVPPPAPARQPDPEPEPAVVGRDSLLDIMVRQFQGYGPPAHRIWLPPLAEPLTLSHLLPPLSITPEHGLTTAGWAGRGKLRAVLGIVDRPFEQRRDPLGVDLSGAAGHLAVVGSPQSGKSTVLRTLIAGLALTHTPREVQFYCLDFGGGTLASLEGLPHVGGVANRLDGDRVRRTVAEVTGLLQQREREFAERGIDSFTTYRRQVAEGTITGNEFGDVFLVVDGWLTVRQDFDSLEPTITDLAARGLGYGIHVVAATNKWSEFRPGIRDLFGSRLELRLGDAYESEVNRKTALAVPEGVPGRGLTRDGLHFLSGLPRVDGVRQADDLTVGVRALVDSVREAWHGQAAPRVRLLPAVLPVDALPGPDATGPRVPIGIDEATLSPVSAEFAVDPHLVVIGDTESGKSNLLRLVAEGVVARHAPSEARLIVIDYRRSLLDAAYTEHRIGYAASSTAAAEMIAEAREALVKRLPPADLTPDQLRSRTWWKGADLYFVVDDYDLVATGTNPLAPLLDLLPQARDIGLHLVLSRAMGGAGRAMFDPVMQRLKDMASPAVILSGDRDEGVLFGVRPHPLPPGRAYYVDRRYGSRLIQTAFLPPSGPSGSER
ncbi:MAG: segregation ATPase FtsK/SpoIIIE -like protein [Sphaerisporangium sp.]|nr:segregation ATPase FtsK/SpoIIIE -like protein [Sphaerisporangium sp.]